MTDKYLNLNNKRLREAVDTLLILWYEEFNIQEAEYSDIKKSHQKMVEAVSDALSLYTPWAQPKVTINWD